MRLSFGALIIQAQEENNNTRRRMNINILSCGLLLNTSTKHVYIRQLSRIER